MRPSDVTATLKAVLPTGQSVWLHGPPGIGKTDIAVAACEAADLVLWRHPPAITIESVDQRGLPFVAEGRTRWASPDLWPTQEDVEKADGKRICIFLDELPQGTTAVQASYMQAVHSRRVGDMKIPDSVVFLACGNRQEDRAGANRVITPLLNRFLHLDLDVCTEDWQAWAIQNGINPKIRGFINFKTNLLHSFDPARNERAFPTPRSWAYLSNVLDAVPAGLRHATASGLVGEGPSAELMSFIEDYESLPDLDEVLKSPAKATIPTTKPSVMYSLCSAMAERSRKLDKLDPLATYAMRFPSEFSALTLRDVYAANAVKSPSGGLKAPPKLLAGLMPKWISQHKDVLALG